MMMESREKRRIEKPRLPRTAKKIDTIRMSREMGDLGVEMDEVTRSPQGIITLCVWNQNNGEQKETAPVPVQVQCERFHIKPYNIHPCPISQSMSWFRRQPVWLNHHPYYADFSPAWCSLGSTLCCMWDAIHASQPPVFSFTVRKAWNCSDFDLDCLMRPRLAWPDFVWGWGGGIKMGLSFSISKLKKFTCSLNLLQLWRKYF